MRVVEPHGVNQPVVHFIDRHEFDRLGTDAGRPFVIDDFVADHLAAEYFRVKAGVLESRAAIVRNDLLPAPQHQLAVGHAVKTGILSVQRGKRRDVPGVVGVELGTDDFCGGHGFSFGLGELALGWESL